MPRRYGKTQKSKNRQKKKRVLTRQEELQNISEMEIPRHVIHRDHLIIAEDEQLSPQEKVYYDILSEELGRKRKKRMKWPWKIGQ